MDDYKQILDRAARLCSSREKCQHDIWIKINNWGLNETDTTRAIKYLIENKFIDDRRFASYFVRDKLKFNKWGRVKIRYSLLQKKIAEDIISDSISEIDPESYNEMLDQIIRSKIRSVGEPNIAKNKAKLIRFAAQRGFTISEIFDSLDRINS